MRMGRKRVGAAVLAAGLVIFAAVRPSAAATLELEFAGDYVITDLGSVPGVPPLYGGLTLLSGDLDTLLIGGFANTASGVLHSIGLIRGAGDHITGFSGVSAYFADAAYNDGGVVYGPGGVLFTSRWPVNELGQLKPGSVATDKIIDLAPFGVASSHAALNFVPAGLPGAGQMKLVSWSGGQFYTAALSPDGLGTFDISSVDDEGLSLFGGPEGFVYLPGGSPGFPLDSMLVSEYSAGRIGTYAIDADGNPILATWRSFITDLSGAEGAFIDPVTGDFLFSTFGGGNRVIVVSGFDRPDGGQPGVVPEPSSLLLLGLGGLASLGVRRQRRNT